MGKVVLSKDEWCGWKSRVLADVYNELVARNAAAHELLSTLDPTGAGVVSEEEFVQLILNCSGEFLSEPQARALSRTIFVHARGNRLQVGDFLSRFSLAFVQSKGMGTRVDAENPLTPYSTTLDQIGKLIVRAGTSGASGPGLAPGPPSLSRFISSPAGTDAAPPPPCQPLLRGVSAAPSPKAAPKTQSSLLATFQQFNDLGDGFLRVDEFVSHVMKLPGYQDIRHDGKPLSEETLRAIAEAIALHFDEDGVSCGDGTINLLQFTSAFVAIDSSGSTEIADDLHEHILTFLYRHRHELRTSCSEKDVEMSGRLLNKDFARVLAAVNFCASKGAQQLTRPQMVHLVDGIAADDGTVDYEKFLSCLEIHAG